MRNELILQNRRRHPRRWLELLILLGFGFCLFIGLGALYLLWSINTQAPPNLSDTLEETLSIEQIVPQLAVRHLNGDPLDGLARQAIQANESATGYSLLLFDVSTKPIASAALWLQLAQQQSEQQAFVPSTLAVQMAQRIALLDPRLQPLERVQFLTQCAKAYVANGHDDLALLTIQQVTKIAAQTPFLLPAQRSPLFNNLKPLLANIAESEESRALSLRVDDFIQNPYLSPTGFILTPTLFSLAQSSVLTDSVVAALLVRQQAAKAWADRYLLTNGVDVEPERQALIVALINENRIRLEADHQSLTHAASIEKRFGILLAQREWLTIRLRIALRGYGLPLVGEWESDLTGIKRELNTNITSLDALFNELAASQPTPTQQAALRLEAALWLAEQAELGLYPDGESQALGQRIQSAQSALEQVVGSLALPIVFDPNPEHIHYDLQERG